MAYRLSSTAYPLPPILYRLSPTLRSVGSSVTAVSITAANPDTAKHGMRIEHGDWERYALEQR